MLIRMTFINGMIALFLIMVIPERWELALSLLLGNFFIVGFLVMCPRCMFLGANIVRLPGPAIGRKEVALTFDDGPDVRVTPLVLDLLDRFKVKASFFCIGEKADAHPELLEEIIKRGHSVENHSYHHRNLFAFYSSSALKIEIISTQKTFSKNGIKARFFRAPMGFRSPLLDSVLRDCNLEHVAWTRRGFDTVWKKSDGVFRRLARHLSAGDVLMLHDGGSAMTSEGQPVVVAVLPELLERCAALGLRGVSLPMAFRDGS